MTKLARVMRGEKKGRLLVLEVEVVFWFTKFGLTLHSQLPWLCALLFPIVG